MSLPERTCVGCGRKAPQAELLRFTARDGHLVPGQLVSGGREPGRGAYTCRRLACWERALASRGFNRVLRRAASIDRALARLYTGS